MQRQAIRSNSRVITMYARISHSTFVWSSGQPVCQSLLDEKITKRSLIFTYCLAMVLPPGRLNLNGSKGE